MPCDTRTKWDELQRDNSQNAGRAEYFKRINGGRRRKSRGWRSLWAARRAPQALAG